MRTKMEHDVGALVLRITVGGLMLFHGIDKLMSGVEWLSGSLEAHGLPAMLRYGVYAGEIVAPLLFILGIMNRTAAALIVLTMVIAVYLTHMGDLFSVGKHGEYALELQVFYLLGAVTVALIGPGRFAVPSPRWLRHL